MNRYFIELNGWDGEITMILSAEDESSAIQQAHTIEGTPAASVIDIEMIMGRNWYKCYLEGNGITYDVGFSADNMKQAIKIAAHHAKDLNCTRYDDVALIERNV